MFTVYLHTTFQSFIRYGRQNRKLSHFFQGRHVLILRSKELFTLTEASNFHKIC